jgi:hypothetical protein
MSLSQDSSCAACPQICKQYSGFGYKFNFDKCSMWTGRKMLANPFFDEKHVLELLELANETK